MVERTDQPGSKEHSADSGHASLAWRDYALILLQLLLLAVVVWRFDLEQGHLLPAAMLIATSGFAIHAWLPHSWRLGFFLLLSIVGIIFVLGVQPAILVLGIGGILIAIACSPMPYWLRVGGLIGAGVVLYRLRDESTAPFWALLGSIFMFRLIVFVFSQRTETVRSTLLQKLSYFFLLPNAFFLLMPVIDFSTFCRNYYDQPRRRIYQSGVHWITVGVVHLLLYRVVRYYLRPSPIEIQSASETALYFAATYGLYLRVSGQFHIICGLLHLFGFRLPRTHDNYFLASSFSDIWRRINIYWKVFMMKTLFLPTVARLRFLGGIAAVAMAVLVVFIGTWLAHSWQTFWLLGAFPITWENALLWGIVGVIVMLNTAWEFHRRRSRCRSQSRNLSGSVLHAFNILLVFSYVSVFWTFWSEFELARGLVFHAVRIFNTQDALVLLAVVTAVALIGVAARSLTVPTFFKTFSLCSDSFSFQRSVGLHLTVLILLVNLTQPAVYSRFRPQVADVIARLRTDVPTHGEALALMDGYYEQLNEGTLQASPFVKNPRGVDPHRGGRFSAMTRYRPDLLGSELIPGWSGTFSDAVITTNRWGMRDRDRMLAKPQGGFRIALVGSSNVMGYGVEDGQTFARQLEELLNASASPEDPRIEVLNFGMGYHFALQRRAMIEQKVFSFDPDLILYFAHQDELYTAAKGLPQAIRDQVSLNDPCLEQLMKELGLSRDVPEFETTTVLQQRVESILLCTYRRIHDLCQARGVPILFVYAPLPGDRSIPYDPRIVLRLAQEAGLETADLDHWWGQHPATQMLSSYDDQHLSPAGHVLFAQMLESVLHHQIERDLE